MQTIQVSSTFNLYIYKSRIGGRGGSMPAIALYMESVTARSRGGVPDTGHRGSFSLPKAKVFELISALQALAEAPSDQDWGVEGEEFRATRRCTRTGAALR